MTREYSVRELQVALAGILKQLVEFLDEHNLKYFAFAGTCLGAVRHHGFIPWDDDIDIAMPRGDYEKFKTLAGELPSNLKYVDSDSMKEYTLMFAKVQDINTTRVESMAYKNTYLWLGTMIDIMPLDGLPDGIKEQKKHRKAVMRAQWLNIRLRLPTDSRTLKGRLSNILFATLRHILPYNYFSKKAKKLAMKYSFEMSKTVFHSGLAACPDENAIIFPKCFFDEQCTVDFEGLKIKAPKNCDEYLKHHYGADYMTPPPESERVTHDVALLDLEKPYKYYYELYQKGEYEFQ